MHKTAARLTLCTLALSLVALVGCGRDEQAHAATRSAAVEQKTVPAVGVYPFDVPGDIPGFYVPSPNGTRPRMIFLHGMCFAGVGDVQAFQFAAHEHGGLVAVMGELTCDPEGVLHKHSLDIEKLDQRIRGAFEAKGASADDLLLIGHSQCAFLGERLAEAFPARYSRIILIGSPSEPGPDRLRHVRGAVMVSGQYDVTSRMRNAAENLASAGIPATYLEMPGAKHGQMGEAERVFGEAFTWLENNAKPKTP